MLYVLSYTIARTKQLVYNFIECTKKNEEVVLPVIRINFQLNFQQWK